MQPSFYFFQTHAHTQYTFVRHARRPPASVVVHMVSGVRVACVSVVGQAPYLACRVFFVLGELLRTLALQDH